MNDIKIGVVGIVVNGEYPNMCIRIEDDSENTGGYLIYQWWEGSNGPNAGNAFDDWVESDAVLREYMKEAKWEIAWK